MFFFFFFLFFFFSCLRLTIQNSLNFLVRQLDTCLRILFLFGFLKVNALNLSFNSYTHKNNMCLFNILFTAKHWLSKFWISRSNPQVSLIERRRVGIIWYFLLFFSSAFVFCCLVFSVSLFRWLEDDGCCVCFFVFSIFSLCLVPLIRSY